MKRLTLLTILLVVVGLASGFALEVKPSFSLTGSAVLTWGIDLDTGHTGFQNTPASSLTVTLMAADGSDTHAGKGAIYGSITISNVELYWTANAEASGLPSVAAQLYIPPIQIGVVSAPTLSSNAAATFETTTLTGIAIIDAIFQADTAYSFGYAGPGTYIKYAASAFTVEADVISEFDWTANVNDAYAIGAQGTVTFAPVTVGFGVFQGFNYATNPLNAFAKLGVSLPFGAANVGFDASFGATFQWEISGDMDFHFNKDGTAYALAKMAYDPQGVNGLDSALSVVIPAASILGPVNLTVNFYYVDLTLPTQDIAATVTAGYTMPLQGDMYLNPTLTAGFANEGATSTNSLYLNPALVVGLAAAPATTVTLGWKSGDLLLATPGMGVVTVALSVTY